MAQVLLKDVSKVFEQQVVAVNQANLTIQDGEFMVIVGPSGCGKTTTLRMIAGLEDITGGTISIGERVVNDVPPKDRDIAMVFQNYALYPHMTVFQNMAFGLKLRKRPKAEIVERVTAAAKLLGIDNLLQRKPKALSGGQRQRVAVGRAIVRNPKAFLFDEPLSNLDAKLRVSTRAELKALHHRLKTTSIYVTHDQAEAMTLGDRICVMFDGNIQQVAPPLEVYDRPINRFVAGFLGAPSMNFIEGKVDVIKDRAFFVTAQERIGLPPKFTEKLTAHQGRDMVLGFRPENLATTPFDQVDHDTITTTVDVVEPLGDRMDVYMTTRDGVRVIANIDPHLRINVGETLKLHIDLPHTHVFEPGVTGANVTL